MSRMIVLEQTSIFYAAGHERGRRVSEGEEDDGNDDRPRCTYLDAAHAHLRLSAVVAAVLLDDVTEIDDEVHPVVHRREWQSVVAYDTRD